MIDWKDCIVPIKNGAGTGVLNLQFFLGEKDMENPYRKGSMIWQLMEGKWNGMTVSEIADALNTTEKSVKRAIRRIQSENLGRVLCEGGSSDTHGTGGMGEITPFPHRRKKPERKCSTCARQRCRIRGTVCNWTHCGDWKEKIKVE